MKKKIKLVVGIIALGFLIVIVKENFFTLEDLLNASQNEETAVRSKVSVLAGKD